MEKRTNHSKNSNMEMCVKAWHLFVADGGVMSLKDFWEKGEYLEKYGICYRTYYDYVSGRSNLYTQTGPRPRTTANKAKSFTAPENETVHRPENENPDRGAHPMSRYWKNFSQLDSVAGGHILGELCRRKKETREQANYRRMQCDFQNPSIAKAQKVWWKKSGLESYRGLVGADDGWLEEEVQLMRECDKTFGPQAVYYEAPKLPKDKSHTMLWESSNKGKAATARRRKRMRYAIERYRLVQARHALSMQKTGKVVTVSLVVALDHLIERYDEGLKSEGLEPSGLRQHFRETNHDRHCKLEAAGDENLKEGVRHGVDFPQVDDLGLSAEERGAFCREMAKKVGEEETLLEFLAGESLDPELGEKIWKQTCQKLADKHAKSELDQLLRVLRRLMPSLPVWSKGVCDEESSESKKGGSDNDYNCDDDANSADDTALLEEAEGSDEDCCYHDDACDSGDMVSATYT